MAGELASTTRSMARFGHVVVMDAHITRRVSVHIIADEVIKSQNPPLYLARFPVRLTYREDHEESREGKRVFGGGQQKEERAEKNRGG